MRTQHLIGNATRAVAVNRLPDARLNHIPPPRKDNAGLGGDGEPGTPETEVAALCLRKLDLGFPAVVDGMDAAAESAYQAWPSRVYLIGRDGRVAFRTRLGELDFRPPDLDAAIREMLAKRERE
jgi:hypothetical protein